MSLVLLLIAFAFSGFSAIMNKALVGAGLSGHVAIFTLASYASGAVIAMLSTLRKRKKGSPADIKVGALMGVAGSLSGLFFLMALSQAQGIVAFPLRSVGNLVFTASVSVVAWHERLSKTQWLAIGLSIVAIWLIY